MPTGSMRVITTPVEIHTVRQNGPRPRPPNNNNNTTNAVPTPTEPTATNQDASAPQAPPPPGGPTQGQTPPGGVGGPFAAGQNGNLEFFMEVTPEGITIDSLETALVGSNQAANECKC